MPKITLRFANNDMGTWELYDGQPVIVGRSPECTIVIDNPGVSRNHCQFEKRGDFCVAVDLNSNNGTYHNGKRIQQANLNDGDEVVIGKHSLVFSAERGAESPVESPMPAADANFGPNTMMIDMNRHATSGPDKRGHLTFKSKKSEQTIMLRKPEYIIGTSPSCDIVVKGFRVSKKHAVIIKDNNGFRIIDVSDKKPTLVNNSPIDRTILNRGDVIKIGPNEFSFYQED